MAVPIKMVVGLGNPGPRYQYTRHNAGFLVLERWAKETGLLWQSRFSARFLRHEGVIYLLPETFMNLSGQAVREAAHYYRLAAHEIVVLSDDLDLPFGTLRIREKGSSGGHNGLKSIAKELGSEQFVRLRIGISRPLQKISVLDWVLMNFSEEEKSQLQHIYPPVTRALHFLVKGDLEGAMREVNGKIFLS